MVFRKLAQVSLVVLAGVVSASMPAFSEDAPAAKAAAAPAPAVVKEDIKPIFCPALSEDKTYDGRYDSYRKLIAGDDGWIFRTGNDLQTHLSINDAAIKMIADWQEKLKEKGIEFVMVYVPTRGMIHSDHISEEDKKTYGFTDVDAVWDDYRDTIGKIRDAGINVVDVPRPAAGTPFFYKRDHHWNASGAKATALAVSEYVKKMPVYEKLAKTKFVTQKKEPYDFFGTTDKVFSKVCNTKQPPERINIYMTERAQAAGAEGDLFGEQPEPEVVLMGTSNSTWEPSFSNFEGFLKEALSTDILNMAVSGGGIDTAMIKYMNSDHKKANKAKLIIWEVPGYYDLNKHQGLFRQAIPGLYGDCGKENLAEATGVAVDDENVVLLEDLADKNMTGSDYYLYLNFSKPIKKPVMVDFRFPKDRDRTKIKRSDRYKPDGEFYLALKNGKKNLDEVSIELAEEDRKDVKVDARICKIP
ncbi:MAG: hypothetical protein KGQ41_01085 [Alphaproteobacteria bacterium]|nr:hypothetical protein [Alphaproteobacteria bacterium]